MSSKYGEKLVLLAQASKPILSALPSVPPSPARPYSGAPITAQARATLQKALDTYKPGLTTLDFHQGTLDPELRSFGETHASELTRISSVADRERERTSRNVPSPPPSPTPPSSFSEIRLPLYQGSPAKRTPPDADPQSPSTPVDPLTLNNNPTPLPAPSTTPEQLLSTTSSEPQSSIAAGTIPTNAPTVAETGVPLTAGRDGPGPVSGSLVGGRHRASVSSSFSTEITGNPFDAASGRRRSSASGSEAVWRAQVSPGAVGGGDGLSAEAEKKRLETLGRERVLAYQAEQSGVGPSRAPTVSRPPQQQHYETAEEEKKRLEREERERYVHLFSLSLSSFLTTSDRLLSGGGNNDNDMSKTRRNEGEDDDENAPPPYEDPK